MEQLCAVQWLAWMGVAWDEAVLGQQRAGTPPHLVRRALSSSWLAAQAYLKMWKERFHYKLLQATTVEHKDSVRQTLFQKLDLLCPLRALSHTNAVSIFLRLLPGANEGDAEHADCLVPLGMLLPTGAR